MAVGREILAAVTGPSPGVRWASGALLLLLAAAPASAQRFEDEFHSSGRGCGYPGRFFDMEKIHDAARQYPNGRVLILTPQEKHTLMQRIQAWNMAGRQPQRSMAPCFNCSQEYEACIVFHRGAAGDGVSGEEAGGDQPCPDGSRAQVMQDRQAYDHERINREWRDVWYPAWKQKIDGIYGRYQAGILNLRTRASWYFDVSIDQNHTVRATLNPSRSIFYGERRGPVYDQWKLLRDRLEADLDQVSAPAFPAGSRYTQVGVTVQFHNLQHDPGSDVPYPQESAEATGEVVPKPSNGCE